MKRQVCPLSGPLLSKVRKTKSLQVHVRRSRTLCLTLVVEHALAEQQPLRESSQHPSEELGCQDIIQNVRNRERLCNDVAQLNEYLKAYFANVHPLLPVLHKEGFFKLYRMYGLKALGDNVRNVMDASTRDGRAVSLICAVLALGALSLVETREATETPVESSTITQLPHFGEALGFYGTCLRLLSYTHDTIESMLAYLLMVILPAFDLFAYLLVECLRNTDDGYKRYLSPSIDPLLSRPVEAFRRLHSFQTQAIALNLGRMFDERGPMEIYDQDLWPGVTTVVVSEMAKRAWSMFRLYLGNVALELGRPSNLEPMDVERPTPVDDEVPQSKIEAKREL